MRSYLRLLSLPTVCTDYNTKLSIAKSPLSKISVPWNKRKWNLSAMNFLRYPWNYSTILPWNAKLFPIAVLRNSSLRDHSALLRIAYSEWGLSFFFRNNFIITWFWHIWPRRWSTITYWLRSESPVCYFR